MFESATQRRLAAVFLASSCVALLAGCGGGGGGGSSSDNQNSDPSSFLTNQSGSNSASSNTFFLGGSSYPTADAAYEQYGQLTVTVGSGGTITGALTVYTPSQTLSNPPPATTPPTPTFVAGTYPITGTGAAGTHYSGRGTITLAGTPNTTAAMTVNGTLPSAASDLPALLNDSVNVTINGQTYTGAFNPQQLN